jgi:hypothetical protein
MGRVSHSRLSEPDTPREPLPIARHRSTGINQQSKIVGCYSIGSAYSDFLRATDGIFTTLSRFFLPGNVGYDSCLGPQHAPCIPRPMARPPWRPIPVASSAFPMVRPGSGFQRGCVRQDRLIQNNLAPKHSTRDRTRADGFRST